MYTWLMLHKSEVLIFLAAFSVRMFFFVFFVSAIPNFPLIGSDSTHYIRDAQRIIEFGRFLSQDASEPNSYETPVYPIFLAFVLVTAKSLLAVPFLQNLIAGFSALAIFRIASSVFTKPVAIGASILFAFDPIGIFYSNYIVTEPLFIFLTLLSVLVLIKNKGFFAGFLLGVTTFVRPVGVVFFLFFVVYPFFRPRILKRNLKAAIIIAVGFILVVGPWLVRNKILFGEFELSVVAGWQFYHSHAPHFYAYMNNIPEREAEQLFKLRLAELVPDNYKDEVLREKAGSLRHSPYMWKVAIDYIKEHPFNYILFHAIKTLPFFFSDGLGEVARDVKIIQSPDPSITAFVLAGDFRGVYRALTADTLAFVIFVVGFFFFFTVAILMVVGFIRAVLDDSRNTALLFMFLILAMALVAGGAVAHPRYRYSVSHFIFILAAHGASLFGAWVHRKLAKVPLRNELT